MTTNLLDSHITDKIQHNNFCFRCYLAVLIAVIVHLLFHKRLHVMYATRDVNYQQQI